LEVIPVAKGMERKNPFPFVGHSVFAISETPVALGPWRAGCPTEPSMSEPKKQWNNYGCGHSADVENITLINNIIADSDCKFKDELVAWFDDRMDVAMSALWGVVP
jgi:hypothetical protein